LRKRVLTGCLVVAAILFATDVVLAATFRSFGLVAADDSTLHRFFEHRRGQVAGRRPPAAG
jgi:hypothetical protein